MKIAVALMCVSLGGCLFDASPFPKASGPGITGEPAGAFAGDTAGAPSLVPPAWPSDPSEIAVEPDAGPGSPDADVDAAGPSWPSPAAGAGGSAGVGGGSAGSTAGAGSVGASAGSGAAGARSPCEVLGTCPPTAGSGGVGGSAGAGTSGGAGAPSCVCTAPGEIPCDGADASKPAPSHCYRWACFPNGSNTTIQQVAVSNCI